MRNAPLFMMILLSTSAICTDIRVDTDSNGSIQGLDSAKQPLWKDSFGRLHGETPADLKTNFSGIMDKGFSDPSEISELNTVYADTNPRISADGLWIVFASDRPGGQGEVDLWEAIRPDRSSLFGAPTLMANGVNSARQDLQPSLTADGLEIVFVRSDGLWNENDLYRATRTNTADPFGPAVPITELNSVDTAEAYPYISPDGLTLYFTSNRPGSSGDDIWLATRPDPMSPFGTPQLVPGVNSSLDELSISLRMDELIGYMAIRSASDNVDIYTIGRSSPFDVFSSPNLLTSLSDPAFDAGPSVTADGTELYFFSMRSGSFDIWVSLRLSSSVENWEIFE